MYVSSFLSFNALNILVPAFTSKPFDEKSVQNYNKTFNYANLFALFLLFLQNPRQVLLFYTI